ncbi:MAG: invasion associated locus B family protein [Sulfitobacter sp.]
MLAAKQRRAAFGLALAALGASPLAAQDKANFPSGNRSTVGDWAVECVANYDNAAGECQLYQRVLTQDPNTAAMVVALAWSPPGKEVLAQISLPLGSDLSQAPSLSIDGVGAASFTWSRCVVSGCLVEAALPDALLAALVQGESAAFTVVQPNAGAIAIPLSLSGFTAGLSQIIPQDAMPEAPAEDAG